MSIIYDTGEIGRRMNRKPEEETAPVSLISQEQAAIRTLKVLGYTYTEGAQMWKPAGALALLLQSQAGIASSNLQNQCPQESKSV